MGDYFLQYYRKNVKQSWKTAFLAAVIIGLCAHLYKFTNTLPNHDSLYSFYNPQNIITSGRWFLTVACGISSYYDLPWIIGLLSILYLALTAVIVTDVFKIENPFVITLTSGLLVVYPSITETLFFEYTADGYFLAMLLAALAAWLTRMETIDPVRFLIAAAFICFSCGIYQAYVSFALVLSISYFVMELLENRKSLREYWLWAGKQAALYVVGLASYYLIWKLCMKVQGVVPGVYQGIDQVGKLSVGLIVHGFKDMVEELMLFLFEWNVFRNGWTVYAAFNAAFLVMLVAALVIAVWKSRTLRDCGRLVLLMLCLIALPMSICIWSFTSETVDYRPMMMGSTCILYVLVVVLLERWGRPVLSNLAGIVLALIIFNNAIQANICYFYLDQCYERTYATALEMVLRIRPLAEQSNVKKLAIAGNIRPEVALDANEQGTYIHMLSPVLEETLMFDHIHVSMYLEEMYDLSVEMLTDKEATELSQTQEVCAMGEWPATDSVKVIGDTIVIKLDDYEAGER